MSALRKLATAILDHVLGTLDDPHLPYCSATARAEIIEQIAAMIADAHTTINSVPPPQAPHDHVWIADPESTAIICAACGIRREVRP